MLAVFRIDGPRPARLDGESDWQLKRGQPMIWFDPTRLVRAVKEIEGRSRYQWQSRSTSKLGGVFTGDVPFLLRKQF